MENRIGRNLCWKIIALMVLLFALLISGCLKKTQPVSPEAGPPEQKGALEPTPSAPTPTPVPATPAAPKAPQTEPKTIQDPIASGSIILNPLVPQDAQMIQTRLAELGLYKGSIEGIWGKGSRAALKAFKEHSSLENPDKWDKESQMALFHGTSQSSHPAPGEDSVSSGSIVLNPFAPEYAQIIQTRLAELGFYKGPIDGAWGKRSRAALKAFKEQSSLGSSDKWDRETQMLLFPRTSK
jgi:peptidoglycan hydrolase-like protein with peptidoglycan-binding domain